MISDVDGDGETLFRGELLALIRMIRGSLAKKCFVDHTVHPVGFCHLELSLRGLPQSCPRGQLFLCFLFADCFKTTGAPVLYDGDTTCADPPGPF